MDLGNAVLPGNAVLDGSAVLDGNAKVDEEVAKVSGDGDAYTEEMQGNNVDGKKVSLNILIIVVSAGSSMLPGNVMLAGSMKVDEVGDEEVAKVSGDGDAYTEEMQGNNVDLKSEFEHINHSCPGGKLWRYHLHEGTRC